MGHPQHGRISPISHNCRAAGKMNSDVVVTVSSLRKKRTGFSPERVRLHQPCIDCTPVVVSSFYSTVAHLVSPNPDDRGAFSHLSSPPPPTLGGRGCSLQRQDGETTQRTSELVGGARGQTNRQNRLRQVPSFPREGLSPLPPMQGVVTSWTPGLA